MVIFGYYLGKQENTKVKKIVSKHEVVQAKKKSIKEKIKKPKVIIKNLDTNVSVQKPIIKIGKEKKVDIQKKDKLSVKSLVAKPKLVIIIDDVSNRRQLKKIQALHMRITPSIFPPSERSMKSHKLARGLKHYMIHLPMESGSKQFNKQYKTLKIVFSKKKIIVRAKELRRLFPKARYINNHTGSVFTNDYRSMFTLYAALKKEGFMFIDSRTIASTKVPKITKKFGDTYVARDVFIDNVHNIKTIHKQLRKAVNIAKKKGYAIAIGHPHTLTMKALLEAKHILKDVELVYIDNLMTI